MRIELWLFLIAGIIIANIYYDGKLLKMVLSHKKHIQIAGVALAFLFLCYMFKKNPHHTKQIIYNSNAYLKYMPIDGKTKSFLEPMIQGLGSGVGGECASSGVGGGNYDSPHFFQKPSQQQQQQQHKRNVSETKKKFVSSSQGWKCGNCKQQLSAFYEVDHIVPLYKGGSNDVSNLVSLCRECHAKKTAMDKMKDDI